MGFLCGQRYSLDKGITNRTIGFTKDHGRYWLNAKKGISELHLLAELKAVMTVVTLCDGNVTNRHDVTVNLPNMTVPLKTVTDVTALLYFVTV